MNARFFVFRALAPVILSLSFIGALFLAGCPNQPVSEPAAENAPSLTPEVGLGRTEIQSTEEQWSERLEQNSAALVWWFKLKDRDRELIEYLVRTKRDLKDLPLVGKDGIPELDVEAVLYFCNLQQEGHRKNAYYSGVMWTKVDKVLQYHQRIIGSLERNQIKPVANDVYRHNMEARRSQENCAAKIVRLLRSGAGHPEERLRSAIKGWNWWANLSENDVEELTIFAKYGADLRLISIVGSAGVPFLDVPTIVAYFSVAGKERHQIPVTAKRRNDQVRVFEVHDFVVSRIPETQCTMP
jgi:hypothetical protein